MYYVPSRFKSSRPDKIKELQEPCTAAQNHNTAAQNGAYPDTAKEVKPDAAAQNCALSEQVSSKAAQEKCAISVQRIPADLPADLAEILAAWPSLPDAVRAGFLATVRAIGSSHDENRTA